MKAGYRMSVKPVYCINIMHEIYFPSYFDNLTEAISKLETAFIPEYFIKLTYCSQPTKFTSIPFPSDDNPPQPYSSPYRQIKKILINHIIFITLTEKKSKEQILGYIYQVKVSNEIITLL